MLRALKLVGLTPTSWPASIRTAIDLALASPQPMLVCWGELAIANDAWSPIVPHDPWTGVPLELRAWTDALHTDATWLDAPSVRRGDLIATPLFDDAGRWRGIAIGTEWRGWPAIACGSRWARC